MARARNEWKVLTFQRVKPPYPKLPSTLKEKVDTIGANVTFSG